MFSLGPRFCPYMRKHGSPKPRILAYFTQRKFEAYGLPLVAYRKNVYT